MAKMLDLSGEPSKHEAYDEPHGDVRKQGSITLKQLPDGNVELANLHYKMRIEKADIVDAALLLSDHVTQNADIDPEQPLKLDVEFGENCGMTIELNGLARYYIHGIEVTRDVYRDALESSKLMSADIAAWTEHVMDKLQAVVTFITNERKA